MKLRSIFALALALGLASGSAGAATYTWNFAAESSFGPLSSYTLNATVGGITQKLAVRAYSTRSTASNDGNWIGANLYNYSGSGLGIKNTVSADGGECCSPEHAVDNNGAKDILVFELPDANWDPVSFMLGWKDTNGDTDVDAWIGGSTLGAGYDFSTTCFSGCGSTLASLSFQNIRAGITNGGGGTSGSGGEDVPTLTTMNFNTPLTGRYLIMTGQLDEGNDYWKLKKVSADHKPPIPVPGSLALVAAGLIGFGAVRRRG